MALMSALFPLFFDQMHGQIQNSIVIKFLRLLSTTIQFLIEAPALLSIKAQRRLMIAHGNIGVRKNMTLSPLVWAGPQ